MDVCVWHLPADTFTQGRGAAATPPSHSSPSSTGNACYEFVTCGGQSDSPDCASTTVVYELPLDRRPPTPPMCSVLCNYEPRFHALRDRITQRLPWMRVIADTEVCGVDEESIRSPSATLWLMGPNLPLMRGPLQRPWRSGGKHIALQANSAQKRLPTLFWQGHRPSSFEVVLHKDGDEVELWSKLLTGKARRGLELPKFQNACPKAWDAHPVCCGWPSKLPFDWQSPQPALLSICQSSHLRR